MPGNYMPNMPMDPMYQGYVQRNQGYGGGMPPNSHHQS